jgi:hypothetical protein
MRNYIAEIEIDYNDETITFNVEYDYKTGGSNFHGSDEPAWEEVDFDVSDIDHPNRDNFYKFSQDYIAECIMDKHDA